jgi:5-methylcytosine-specific restriction enzyme A
MSPYAPKHPCGFPGCPILVDPNDRLCERHRAQERKEIDQRRGSAARRGYDSRWRSARERFLTLHPLCVLCQLNGILTAAAVVDHIVPHKGIPEQFWDESNWQALCRSCHSSKTAASDGRWG